MASSPHQTKQISPETGCKARQQGFSSQIELVAYWAALVEMVGRYSASQTGLDDRPLRAWCHVTHPLGVAPPVRPDHARALVATSLAALLRKSISVDEWGMMVSIIVSTAEKTATVMKGVLEEKQDAINNMQKREAGLNFWPLPKCFFYWYGVDWIGVRVWFWSDL